MVTSEHIITVTEIDFEYEVIEYSKNTPVLVDFWNGVTCRMLGLF
jgi:thioredoxin-like negative regulator of GroEL